MILKAPIEYAETPELWGPYKGLHNGDCIRVTDIEGNSKEYIFIGYRTFFDRPYITVSGNLNLPCSMTDTIEVISYRNGKYPMLTPKQEAAYTKYVEEHCEAVDICYSLRRGGVVQHVAPAHDASKWSHEEFVPYARYFYDENGERKKVHTEKETEDFNKAWLHHIHNNPHHWQYWVIPGEGPIEMPGRYVEEMIADWGAFALIKQDPQDIIDFWEKQKKRYQFTADLYEAIDEEVHIMAELIDGYLHMENEEEAKA